MKRKLWLAVFLCCLAAGVLWVKRLADRAEIPARVRLGEIKSASNSFAFTCPKGHRFNFVIGSKETGLWDASRTEGLIRVYAQKELVSEFKFTGDTTAPCNWLDAHQLHGTVLDWTPNWDLEKQLKAGETYEVLLDFSTAAPAGTSLWLTFLQNYKDFRAAKRTANQ